MVLAQDDQKINDEQDQSRDGKLNGVGKEEDQSACETR
jgi:hypothetical protein